MLARDAFLEQILNTYDESTLMTSNDEDWEADLIAYPPSTRARIVLLQALCESQAAGNDPSECLYRSKIYASLKPDKAAVARKCLRTITQEGSKLDDLIKDKAHQSFASLSLVDINILRLGFAESLVRPSTPKAVIINEAVKLAKIFSGESSFKFINGVLGALLKDRKEDPPHCSIKGELNV